MSELKALNSANAPVNPAPTNNTAKEEVKNVKKNNDTIIKKALIGTGTAVALTGIAIGGIRYHKGVQFKKALNEVSNTLKNTINNIKLRR